jgi:hypothetical protein
VILKKALGKEEFVKGSEKTTDKAFKVIKRERLKCSKRGCTQKHKEKEPKKK